MNSGRRPRDEEIHLWRNYVDNVARISHQQTAPQNSVTIICRPSEPCRSAVLDLHGLSAAEAYTAFCAFVEGSKGVYRRITVVTGMGGLIRREFEHWVANRSEVRHAEILPGGGAFRLHLRKQ